MAIRRLLRKRAFDQEGIGRMVAAYEAALSNVQLADRNDPIIELIAKEIIDVARGGERDPSQIGSLAFANLVWRPSVRCRIEN